MRGMTYLFLGMSRRVQVLDYNFLLWYRPSSVSGAVLLIVDTFIATGHISCVVRIVWQGRSPNVLFMLQLRDLLLLDFLFLKGNAVDLFGNKCVIVCFQCTVHSAPRLLLLTKGYGLSQFLWRAVWSRRPNLYSGPYED